MLFLGLRHNILKNPSALAGLGAVVAPSAQMAQRAVHPHARLQLTPIHKTS